MKKQFLDVDVVTESKRRIHRLYDEYDSVVVSFSGGKDSSAVLWLCRQVLEERGDSSPVLCRFIDQEVYAESLVDFVDEVRQFDWVQMSWFVMQQVTRIPSLRWYTPMKFWDPDRESFRPRPTFPEVVEEPDPTVIHTYSSMDRKVAEMFPGRVALLLGIRADESLYRFRSVVGREVDGWINSSETTKLDLAKPIYDWAENDVFRFLYDSGVPLAKAYHERMLTGMEMRTSTFMVPVLGRNLETVKQMNPDHYDRLVELFPQMRVHGMYQRELDTNKIVKRWGKSYSRVREWIELTCPHESVRDVILGNFDRTVKYAEKHPHLYTPEYVLRSFMNGTFGKDQLVPMS